MQQEMVVPRNKWLVGIVLGIVATIILLGGVFTLKGATSSVNPSDIPAKPVGFAPRGYWQGVNGDVNIADQAVGEIYNYDWFAVDIVGPHKVRVTWDNGSSCSRTEGIIVGQKARLQQQGVLTTFVFHDDKTATVTFRKGAHLWIKQLEKLRADPAVPCF